MRKFNKYLLAILASAAFVTACDEEEKLIQELEENNPIPGPVTGDPGALDFSNYVAIGNSISAGYMDGALYNSGQEHSFPNLLAQQFQINGIGGGDFNQPDINSANGYSGPGADGIPGTSDDLGRFELSLSQRRPVPTAGEAPTPFGGDKRSLNNFGVPGMAAVQANDPSLALTNPLYGRFASQPGTSTVLGDALAVGPSFFTYWLGNNDILGYAVGGGANESLITPQPALQAAVAESLGALVQSGAQGAVMTVPLLVTLPYFNAVPYNAIALTDPAQVAQLNGAFAAFNGLLDQMVQAQLIAPEDAARRKVNYAVGANPILMFDDALDDLGPRFDALLQLGLITPEQRAGIEPYRQSRPATSNDRPVLPSAAVLGTPYMSNPQAVIGITFPAMDNLILSQSEAATVVGTRATYNATIAGVVAQINQQAGAEVISLVDVQPAFADIAGLSPAQASFLVDPTMGANPILASMATNAAARADGELGIEINGINLAPDFTPNGVYSTDGIHPNPRGMGLLANEIIAVLNANKGASIPNVNVLALRSVIATQ